MPCYQPLLAVNLSGEYYTSKVHIFEDGKNHVRILPKFETLKGLEYLRDKYGKQLMFLPCNKCVGCAKDYARMWQTRIMCEFEYHTKACFLTLTYGAHCPGRPIKQHLREFVKAVRNKYGKGIKFFGCGEKGDLNSRAHYHLILFGVDFAEDRVIHSKRGLNLFYRSKTAANLWKKGFVLVGDLGLESAGYVSRYCDKKKIKGMSEGEFVIMSRGLGKQYLLDHKDNILDSDFLYFKGQKFKIPRYYLKLAKNFDFYHQILFEDYKDKKREIASNFRYGSNMSIHYEEEGLEQMKHYHELENERNGGLRNVGVY